MLRAFVLGALFALWVAPVAQSAQVGTREEAAAMVKRVQEKFKTDGPEATFKAITSQARIFHDRDLYPFVYTLEGVAVAHGAKPELIGKNWIDLRDQNGKYIIREMIEIAQNSRGDWVDYRWQNPTNNTIEDKTAYVERMGSYFVGVGVYRADQTNQNTIAIISGGPSSDSTYLQIAYDLSAALNDGDDLRILPVIGIGGVQNIRDVRNLKGIDIGLTETNVLNGYRRTNNEMVGNGDEKIVYIAELFNEEVHLIARSDIQSLDDLRGKKVNIDVAGSGTLFTMRDIFKHFGIKVEELNLAQDDALEKLKAGEIAATAFLAGKPARSIAHITMSDGLHMIRVPYERALQDDYIPVSITHDDYPNLIATGEVVHTVGVGTVLIAYNWSPQTDRYRRVEKFVDAFFAKFSALRDPPRHPKWRDVNLGAVLPGWTRFGPAQAALDRIRQESAASVEKEKFDKFVGGHRGPITPQQREALFEEFMKWQRGQTAQ